MNDRALQMFLQGLRGALSQTSLYPPDHPKYGDAVDAGMKAVAPLTRGGDEALIAVRDDVCYLNGKLSAHTSLMFASLIATIRERGVESITLSGPVVEEDYRDLVRFLAGLADIVPSRRSIRLNEVRVDEMETSVSGLQTSYIGAIGSLRRAGQRLAGTGSIELAPVMAAVDVMIDQSLSASSAALLLSTVSSHDEYTFYHSVNTCLMVVALAQLVGLSRDEVVAMGAGAVLHDVGKVAITRGTLNHPGRLSKDQWKEIALHPQEGAQAILIAGGPGHEIAAAVALEHHARYDGLGYPHVPNRKRPHLFSSLVSVVDVYDALTTRRPYRRSHTPNRALQLLLQGAGTAFDPQLVKLFIEMMGIFPPGSVLRLDSGALVVVAEHGLEMPDLTAILVRDATGAKVAPEPIAVALDEVAEQVPADSVGIEPASLINESGLSAMFAPVPASRGEKLMTHGVAGASGAR